jgi:hypothetical protein
VPQIYQLHINCTLHYETHTHFGLTEILGFALLSLNTIPHLFMFVLLCWTYFVVWFEVCKIWKNGDYYVVSAILLVYKTFLWYFS